METLSKRLLTAYELAEPAKVIADIGTDHAYLPVHLLKTGKADFAVCCDINSGPLSRAEKTIKDHNLTDRVSLRQGSGLSPLEPGEADTIFVCGMGGSLIISILENDRQKALSADRLILQPQNDIPKVRKYLTENQFLIEAENMVLDGGFFYTVLSVKQGDSPPLSEAELLLGPCLLKERPSVFLDYINQQKTKLEALSELLREKSTPAALEKLSEIQHTLDILKEAV